MTAKNGSVAYDVKAELKKKGIETRGLLEDADVVDAYLAATGRLSMHEWSSFRPQEESRKRPRDEGSALGGAAASSPAAVRAAEPTPGGDAGSAPGSECVMLWGRCWQQLRYK